MEFIILILFSILWTFTSSSKASWWLILIIFSLCEAKKVRASSFAIAMDSVAATFSSCQISSIIFECDKMTLFIVNQ